MKFHVVGEGDADGAIWCSEPRGYFIWTSEKGLTVPEGVLLEATTKEPGCQLPFNLLLRIDTIRSDDTLDLKLEMGVVMDLEPGRGLFEIDPGDLKPLQPSFGTCERGLCTFVLRDLLKALEDVPATASESQMRNILAAVGELYGHPAHRALEIGCVNITPGLVEYRMGRHEDY